MGGARPAVRWLLAAYGMILVAAGLTGLFLRVAQLRELVTWLGAETSPDYYLRYPDYFYRTACGMAAWLGAFFLLAARDPVRHAAVVRLCAWGLLVWGGFALLLGTWIAMPASLWGTNAVVSASAGAVLLWLTRRARLVERSSGPEAPL